MAFYIVAAEEQGVAPGAAERHHPERHPERVHGPQHLHLPAGAVDADHRRHLPRTAPRRCRSSTASRSAAITCRRRARRPISSSATRSPTAWSTSARASPPGLDIDDFAPRLSFFWAHRHEPLHGDRQAARRARAVGEDREGLRPEEPEVDGAAHALADLGLEPDGAGRLQQRHAHLRRGAGRGARPHAVAAHQRARRGASRCRPTSRRASRATRRSTCRRRPASRRWSIPGPAATTSSRSRTS